MSKAAIFRVVLGLFVLWAGSAPVRAGDPPRQLLRVLSPEWLVWVHDYNDETDRAIYEANRAYFDDVLIEQERLEDENQEPNWVRWKARRAAWARGYAQLSTQHRSLAQPGFFSITSADDPAYAESTQPAQAISWVQPLGDRLEKPDAPLRNCREHQVGHYAFLKLPTPMKDGATYRLVQKDGREARLTYRADETRIAGFKLNQIGYHPAAPRKYAYLGGWIPTVGGVPYAAYTNFAVRRAGDGEEVLRGGTRLLVESDWRATTNAKAVYSGEDTYELDISALTNEGTFYLTVDGLGRSGDFQVSRTIMGEPFFVQARGFYQQRCGTALTEPFTAWTRLACHTSLVYASSLIGNGGDHWLDDQGNPVKDIKGVDFEILRATGRTNGPGRAIWGGWHDAADYDRRQSHHYALWDLLGTYELNAAAFTDGQLNLPESGNGVPDLLDEAVWGLQVWVRAQRADGAVCGRLETYSHPHHAGMPDRDPDPWFASEPTRESTMYFAASAAWLARLLDPFDAKTAADFRARAEKAYTWAAHGTTAPSEAKLTLNVRRDGAKEAAPVDLTWREKEKAHYLPALLAAQELRRQGGGPGYLEDVVNTFGPHGVKVFKIYPSYLYETWPLMTLARDTTAEIPDNLKAEAQAELVRIADERLPMLEATPYKHPWNPNKSRRWGGALPATFARYFILAHALTGEERYRSAARLCADFHLGANPLGYSHTTGLGTSFPPAIQDAETRSDSWFEPVPGLTPYGIIIYPYSTLRDVYRMTVPPEQKGGAETTLSFLPAPFDQKEPPIPEWRRIGPHSGLDPLCNEFTMQETLSPALFLFGSLLEPGWQPDPSLKQRKPRDRKELAEAWFRLP